MLSFTRSIFVLVILALPTAAQEPDQPTSQATTKSVLGRGPLFTLQLAGPKAMQQAVLPTNLGALLSSPEGKLVQDLWQLILRGIVEEVRTESARDAWAALQKRLLGYGGRLDVEFHVTNREVRPNNWVRHDVAGHMLLWPDGSTDMAKLSEEVRAFLVGMTRETPKTQDFGGGKECEFLGRPNDDGISLPMKYGDQGESGDQGDALVLFFGNRIGKAISGGIKRLGLPRSKEVHAERNSAWRKPGQLGRLDVDMAQVAVLLADDIRRPEQRQLMQKFFGTGSWEWAGSSIRTAGPQILIETTMDCKQGKDRGFFAGVLPDITTLPKLAWMAPHGTEEKPAAFVASHVRIDKLYNLFLELLGNLFRSKLRPLDEIKAEAREKMGFDFETEFLAHLSTEVLGLSQIDEGEERDRKAKDGDGLCFVTRITNQEGFETTYKKLRVHPGLRPGVPQEIEGGEAIPVRGPFRGEFIGRTKKVFFYAIGDRGLEVLKTFLRQSAEAGDQPPLPKIVQRAFRNTPPGWNAAGVLPSRWLRDPMCGEVLWEIWREIDDIFPREVRRTMTRDVLIQGAEKAAPILKKYRLDRMVLFGGWEPRAAGAPERSRARVRLLW